MPKFKYYLGKEISGIHSPYPTKTPRHPDFAPQHHHFSGKMVKAVLIR